MRAFIICLTVLFLSFVGEVVAKSDEAQLNTEGTRIWHLLPRPSEMIRHPSPESWQIYGGPKFKTVKAAGLPGGEARRVRIKRAGKTPYDVGANAPTQLKTEAGDVLLGAVWARATKFPDGETRTELPLHIQQQGGDYEQFASITVMLTSDWHQYFVYAEMPRAMKKGSVGLAIHLSGAAHEIELGPLYIMNLGPGAVDAASMPKNTYAPAAVVAASPSVSSAPQTSVTVPDALRSDLSAIRAQLPNSAKLISPAASNASSVYGENESHRLVKNAAVVGGEAVEVTVRKTGLNSWSTGINRPLSSPINKGDVVFLAYWAKGIEAKNEAQTPIISPVNVQQSGPPYKSAASGAAYLLRDWQLYYASGKAEDDIAPGAAGISFHLGLTKQTLQLGPAYLFNLGPNADVTSLPRNRVTYDGIEPNAPWRSVAKAKIEQHRKGNLTVKVADGNGNPKPNVSVDINMTDHAFNFGTFVGHKLIDNNGKKDARYHQSFNENFNMATLPTYWQDWGWNSKKSMEAGYRNSIKFAHEQGIKWRAHPIIWPGEDYMPSRILVQKGKPKKQREMVLSHVKEVMSFVASHNPIAIDLVNEVRVNQYFKENGNPDLVEEVFRLAHDIAPDVPLYVNDYAILNNGGLNKNSIEFYHNWIKEMQGKNVPLGGIGFQGHFGAGLTPPQRVMDILGGFSKYGLPLQITEFDVETYDEEAQAAYTRDILMAAFSEPALNAFIVWGWWEGDHWKKPAAMLREDWSEKLNFKAWRKAVYSDWWTREQGMTDSNGELTIRGFKGDYQIRVGTKVMNATLDDAETVAVIVP
jgi:endo-1,4-beta-xylanase